MPLKLNVLNSPPMDGWKNEIKNDGWWLMKILWTHVQRELIDQSKNEKWGAWCSVAIEINKDK